MLDVDAPVAAPPALLTTSEAAEYLATSERHVRRLVSERRIGFVKVGHFVRFLADDLEAFLQQGRVVPSAADEPRDVT